MLTTYLPCICSFHFSIYLNFLQYLFLLYLRTSFIIHNSADMLATVTQFYFFLKISLFQFQVKKVFSLDLEFLFDRIFSSMSL